MKEELAFLSAAASNPGICSRYASPCWKLRASGRDPGQDLCDLEEVPRGLRRSGHDDAGVHGLAWRDTRAPWNTRAAAISPSQQRQEVLDRAAPNALVKLLKQRPARHRSRSPRESV
jgi:hypothetical protein